MKDFVGREIQPGQFVVQAAASGHHKYLKVAVVLKVNEEDRSVKVQSETRPGNVEYVNRRLMILDDTKFIGEDRINQLNKIFKDWTSKNESV